MAGTPLFTNLAKNPEAVALTGSVPTNFSNGSSGTAAVTQTDGAWAGVRKAARLTRTASGAGRAAYETQTGLAPSITFSVRVTVRSSVDAAGVVLNYRPNVAVATSNVVIATKNLVAGVPTEFTGTFTTPATGPTTGGLVFTTPTAPIGSTFDMTKVLIVGGSTLPEFFSGATPDTFQWDYAWNGTADASASTKSRQHILLEPPPLPDPLQQNARREFFRVDLMTNQDGTIGQLDGVSNVSLTFSADENEVLTSGGSLHLDDQDQDIDWLNARCQPWANVNGVEWPLGVYIMSAPTVQYDPTGKSWDVTLKDKTAILDQSWIAQTYGLDAGQNVVAAIQQVITDAGETNYSISADPRVLNGPLTWPPNTSRLTIVQDLLKLINFMPLWVDGWGAFIGVPHVDPDDRPVDYAFEEGDTAIHLPSFQVTKDVANVPNRLIGVSSTSSTGISVTADNNDPTSQYSIPARGRIIAQSQDFDAPDFATLADLTARRMRELMAPASVVEFQHATVPLQVNSVVEFTSDDISINGVVLSTTVNLAAGQLMQTTIREVVTVALDVS